MRLPSDTRTFSSWQSIPSSSFIGRKIVSGDIVVFPPGNKYEVAIVATIDAYGESTKAYVRLDSAGGDILLLFDSTLHPSGTKLSATFTINESESDQSLYQSQNSGTNAGIDYIISYRSTPAIPSLVSAELMQARNKKSISNFATKAQVLAYENAKVSP